MSRFLSLWDGSSGDNADETICLARSVTRSRASRLIYGERRLNIFKLKQAPSAFTGLAGCPRAADKAWLRSCVFPRPGFALAGTQSKWLMATQDVHKEKETLRASETDCGPALSCFASFQQITIMEESVDLPVSVHSWRRSTLHKFCSWGETSWHSPARLQRG